MLVPSRSQASSDPRVEGLGSRSSVTPWRFLSPRLPPFPRRTIGCPDRVDKHSHQRKKCPTDQRTEKRTQGQPQGGEARERESQSAQASARRSDRVGPLWKGPVPGTLTFEPCGAWCGSKRAHGLVIGMGIVREVRRKEKSTTRRPARQLVPLEQEGQPPALLVVSSASLRSGRQRWGSRGPTRPGSVYSCA